MLLLCAGEVAVCRARAAVREWRVSGERRAAVQAARRWVMWSPAAANANESRAACVKTLDTPKRETWRNHFLHGSDEVAPQHGADSDWLRPYGALSARV